MTYIKSVGKYVFLFPVGVERQVKVQKVKFPYALLPLSPYVALFAYLSVFVSLVQVLIILSVAVIYNLIEEGKARVLFLSFLAGASAVIGLDYLVAVAYGVLGGFVFGSEVYVDEEWHVYLRPNAV